MDKLIVFVAFDEIYQFGNLKTEKEEFYLTKRIHQIITNKV